MTRHSAFAIMAFVLAAAAIPGGLRAAKLETRSISFANLRQDPEAAFAPQRVEIYGFLLPSDQEGAKVYEFMLVSRPGACSHAAQPPADQIVRIVPDAPFDIDRLYQPVKVTGLLQREDNVAQIFILDGVTTVESAYRMRLASVELMAGALRAPDNAASPWKFLND